MVGIDELPSIISKLLESILRSINITLWAEIKKKGVRYCGDSRHLKHDPG